MPQRSLRKLKATRERRDAEIQDLVAQALHAGVRTQDIADALKISRSTFWRRYANQLHRHDRAS